MLSGGQAGTDSLSDLGLEAGSLGDEMTVYVLVCFLVFIRYSDEYTSVPSFNLSPR